MLYEKLWRLIITASLCFYTWGNVLAQKAVFEWQDELCDHVSVFDSTIYSRVQIENAHAFIYLQSYYLSTPMVFKPGDIARIDLDKLEKDYIRLRTALLHLDLPSNKTWTGIKQTKLNELDQYYALSRIKYQAYLDETPEVLRKFDRTDSLLKKYADALIAGGDTLLKVWYDLIAVRAPKNADPEAVWRKYRDQYRSPDRMRYAKVEVLTFGWGNHANGLIDRLEYDQALYREFFNLFSSTKRLQCEEP